jgi:hypothetical protein
LPNAHPSLGCFGSEASVLGAFGFRFARLHFAVTLEFDFARERVAVDLAGVLLGTFMAITL